MRSHPLGRTGIQVSRICLGTMTFGEQVDRDTGFEMLDMAFERGVNFFDTAEMYSFPMRPETQGASERILGEWVESRGVRDRVVLATKITGPGPSHIAGGHRRYDAEQIPEAVAASLERLRTDRIDLYQTHWPERPSNFFGRLGYTHDAAAEFTPFRETLEAVKAEIDAGRVRAFGVSNETAWGLSQLLALGDRTGLPRVAAIQNPYNLLNRTFEVGLAEIAIREDCGLLAYSPLGFGALTGKYLDGTPKGSRIDRWPEYRRYFQPRGVEATRAYVEIARAHGLDAARMALAFVNRQPFLTSTIVGATSPAQLAHDLDAEDLVLSESVLEAIEAVHAVNPNPAP